MVRWGGYMRFPVFASIRASLVFLVLLALLPALGIMLFTGYTLRQSVIRNTENAALRQVQAMAAHHERVVDNARLLLATMAKAGEVQRLDALACQVLLEDMRSREAAYVALALADEHGRIVATSPPMPLHLSSMKSTFRTPCRTCISPWETIICSPKHTVW